MTDRKTVRGGDGRGLSNPLRSTVLAFTLAVGSVAACRVQAETALVASAANFAPALEALADEFAARTPHRVRTVTGSTGKLYAQIRRGAPFDVLLAADAQRPALLEAEATFAVPGTRFTYALGRLVLWSRGSNDEQAARRADLPTALGTAPLRPLAAALKSTRKLAIANPQLAPYGSAAVQTLQALDLDTALAARLVFGENIGQAHALAATGNASHVLTARALTPNAGLLVPADLHQPIRQDAVLLTRGANNPAALAWLRFLASEAGHACIETFGFDLPASTATAAPEFSSTLPPGGPAQ